MIFRLFTLYKDAKEGSQDPTGFAVKTIKQSLLGLIIIPILIVLLMLIGLWVLGFTSLIGDGSSIARVFFWIILLLTILGGAPMLIIGLILNTFLNKSASRIQPTVTKIKTKAETVVSSAINSVDKKRP